MLLRMWVPKLPSCAGQPAGSEPPVLVTALPWQLARLGAGGPAGSQVPWALQEASPGQAESWVKAGISCLQLQLLC